VRLVHDLGDTDQILLRNHGTLALGSTPGEAWSRIYQLESACFVQVAALAGGRDHILIAPEEAQQEARRQLAARPPVSASSASKQGAKSHGHLVWEAVLRRVQRENPGFDT
jgi:ribulose-5-phosphate 4-epimerase/fuculose-1-phosphate aldolase